MSNKMEPRIKSEVISRSGSSNPSYDRINVVNTQGGEASDPNCGESSKRDSAITTRNNLNQHPSEYEPYGSQQF